MSWQFKLAHVSHALETRHKIAIECFAPCPISRTQRVTGPSTSAPSELVTQQGQVAMTGLHYHELHSLFVLAHVMPIFRTKAMKRMCALLVTMDGPQNG
jgi:hypothetical protein